MANKVTVSVGMIAYNHEKFVAQAIRGVLDQETDFDYELIISNDCSPDGTDRVIRETIAAHPKGGIVKYFNQKKNLGPQANSAFVIDKYQGRYIAGCEGDDYWTDRSKLQKQFAVLEASPNVNIVYHDVDILLGKKIIAPPPVQDTSLTGDKNVFTKFDLARKNLIPTVSVMYRKLSRYEYPDWHHSFPVGDYFHHHMHIGEGLIVRIPERMAVYRLHQGSTWSSNSMEKRARAFVTLLDLMQKDAAQELVPHFAFHKTSALWNAALWYFHNGQPETYLRLLPEIHDLLKDLSSADMLSFNDTALRDVASSRKMDVYFKLVAKFNDYKKMFGKRS